MALELCCVAGRHAGEAFNCLSTHVVCAAGCHSNPLQTLLLQNKFDWSNHAVDGRVLLRCAMQPSRGWTAPRDTHASPPHGEAGCRCGAVHCSRSRASPPAPVPPWLQLRPLPVPHTGPHCAAGLGDPGPHLGALLVHPGKCKLCGAGEGQGPAFSRRGPTGCWQAAHSCLRPLQRPLWCVSLRNCMS